MCSVFGTAVQKTGSKLIGLQEDSGICEWSKIRRSWKLSFFNLREGKKEEKKGGGGSHIMPFINIHKIALKKNIFSIHGRQQKLKRDVCKIPLKTLSGKDYAH